MHIKEPKNSEVDAYSYIKDELGKLGWKVKNPARFLDGEVYKQNEVLSNVELKKWLVRDMPEAVVMLSDSICWVIESKRDIHELPKALDEGVNQYAKKINQSKHVKCAFVSGVAGNDTDGYEVANLFIKDGVSQKILINGVEKTSLLSKKEALEILATQNPHFSDFPELSEEKFLSTAEKINEILHLAAINKSKRARFIAGIILSFIGKTKPNLDKDTKPLVKEINDNIESVLADKDKRDFYDFISLQLPPNEDNHLKYKKAIVQTYRELEGLDIKAAMNSGNDILGKFYEVFLKYGNGAKEIGIVLTPRHITQFAVEVMGITHHDFVYDPTCGTGGFLVSAFDHVKSNSKEEQVDVFKKNNIFGLEQEDDVVALALVNMIFRGDGRNNIREGNCFQKHINKTVKSGVVTGEYGAESKDDKIITKVLMNPPFALKTSDEQEYHFIDYALSQMTDGGTLFSILPMSVLVEPGTEKWRKNVLLKHHTVLAVVTLPEDLFYPVSVGTIGIFIKKGFAHSASNPIYFARATSDGFLKKKGKRLFSVNAEDRLSLIRDELKTFLANQDARFDNVPELKKVVAIDPAVDIELAAEAYIDSREPDVDELESGINQMLRESVAFQVKYSDRIDKK